MVILAKLQKSIPSKEVRSRYELFVYWSTGPTALLFGMSGVEVDGGIVFAV